MLSADDEIQSEWAVSGATQWQAAIQPVFAASVLAIAHAHCAAGVPTSVAHPHPWHALMPALHLVLGICVPPLEVSHAKHLPLRDVAFQFSE
jgi:hypothetical protein